MSKKLFDVKKKDQKYNDNNKQEQTTKWCSKPFNTHIFFNIINKIKKDAGPPEAIAAAPTTKPARQRIYGLWRLILQRITLLAKFRVEYDIK